MRSESVQARSDEEVRHAWRILALAMKGDRHPEDSASSERFVSFKVLTKRSSPQPILRASKDRSLQDRHPYSR